MRDNCEKFKVASYIRLSREDGDKQESESIGNQRDMIQRYVEENQLELVDEYVDDGVSGTTFDRPGFNRLIADIESGKINMIVTKDFSRLGREYIQLGHYMEVYFPEHKIRYVALNDGIDTFANSSWSELTPFRAIINDSYAKDISKKVRSVLREKQRKGEYMCTYAPYGYQKDLTQKNHLVVDENVAYVVRKIFNLYLAGNSIHAIQKYLNEKGIQSPSGYAKNLSEIKKWNVVTLRNLLQNKVYIGHTVANKRVKISYKTKKRVKLPEEQYVVTEYTHDAIISKEDFEKVQFLLKKRGMNQKTKREYCLRGLLKCKTCHSHLEVGAKLTKKGKVIKNPIAYITCRNARKGFCLPQHLNYGELEKVIFDCVDNFLKMHCEKEKLEKIYQRYQNQNVAESKKDKELEEINKQINDLTRQMAILYEDRLKGIITESDFVHYGQKIRGKKEILESCKQEKEEKLGFYKDVVKEKKLKIDQLVETFLKKECFSKRVLFQLIEKIEIDEKKNVWLKFGFREKKGK